MKMANEKRLTGRYTLYDRIEKRGWSVEKALETPVGAKMDGGNEDV